MRKNKPAEQVTYVPGTMNNLEGPEGSKCIAGFERSQKRSVRRAEWPVLDADMGR